MIHKPKSENTEIATIRTSSESHLHWEHYFQKVPVYFRIIADFEADIEIDSSSMGNKTTNGYKQR